MTPNNIFPLDRRLKIGFKSDTDPEITVRRFADIELIIGNTYHIITVEDPLSPSTIGQPPYNNDYYVALNHVDTDWYRVENILDISMNGRVARYTFDIPANPTPYKAPKKELKGDTEESR